MQTQTTTFPKDVLKVAYKPERRRKSMCTANSRGVSSQDFSNIPSGIIFEFSALILCDPLWNLKGGVGNCTVPNDSQIHRQPPPQRHAPSISSCLLSIYTTRLIQRQSIYLQQNPEVKEDPVERQEQSLESLALLGGEKGCSTTLQTVVLAINNRGDSERLELSITALA